ncbi:hypothetical protein C8R47DRAFT_1127773 [Mycena vitilis]|nr:hypothetical protein C8R47DRAFT_1127773 [Mycena vitilis]
MGGEPVVALIIHLLFSLVPSRDARRTNRQWRGLRAASRTSVYRRNICTYYPFSASKMELLSSAPAQPAEKGKNVVGVPRSAPDLFLLFAKHPGRRLCVPFSLSLAPAIAHTSSVRSQRVSDTMHATRAHGMLAAHKVVQYDHAGSGTIFLCAQRSGRCLPCRRRAAKSAAEEVERWRGEMRTHAKARAPEPVLSSRARCRSASCMRAPLAFAHPHSGPMRADAGSGLALLCAARTTHRPQVHALRRGLRESKRGRRYRGLASSSSSPSVAVLPGCAFLPLLHSSACRPHTLPLPGPHIHVRIHLDIASQPKAPHLADADLRQAERAHGGRHAALARTQLRRRVSVRARAHADMR